MCLCVCAKTCCCLQTCLCEKLHCFDFVVIIHNVNIYHQQQYTPPLMSICIPTTIYFRYLYVLLYLFVIFVLFLFCCFYFNRLRFVFCTVSSIQTHTQKNRVSFFFVRSFVNLFCLFFSKIDTAMVTFWKVIHTESAFKCFILTLSVSYSHVGYIHFEFVLFLFILCHFIFISFLFSVFCRDS